MKMSLAFKPFVSTCSWVFTWGGPGSLCFFFFFNNFIYFIILFYLFIVFGCVGSSLLRAGFFLVEASGAYSLLRCAGFSLQWPLLFQSTGPRHAGFSSCGTRAQ